MVRVNEHIQPYQVGQDLERFALDEDAQLACRVGIRNAEAAGCLTGLQRLLDPVDAGVPAFEELLVEAEHLSDCVREFPAQSVPNLRQGLPAAAGTAQAAVAWSVELGRYARVRVSALLLPVECRAREPEGDIGALACAKAGIAL